MIDDEEKFYDIDHQEKFETSQDLKKHKLDFHIDKTYTCDRYCSSFKLLSIKITINSVAFRGSRKTLYSVNAF
jgi:hypothetical protein